MIAIGVDIGGTTSRVAAIDCSFGCGTQNQNRDREGAANSGSRFSPSRDNRSTEQNSSGAPILAQQSAPTPRDQNGHSLIDWIVDAVRDIRADLSIATSRIGLALPGPVDRDRGILLRSVNLPFLENRPIVRELQEKACQPVTLWTDAEAATWAEYIAIDPAPASFAHLRIGTGVACGIIVDGEFVYPPRTNGGHLDLLVVDHSPTATKCPCGKRGCLEAIASGVSLTRNGQNLAALQLAYESGDEETRELVNLAARAINSAITNTVKQFGVTTIILGGGVIENLPALFDGVLRENKENGSVEGIAISRHKLGDAAGVIGAAILAARDAGNG